MSQPASNVPAAGVPMCYRHPGRETYIKCQRCERPICPDCMRDAAVGFQCPQCVAEGARSTRSARAAYGGQRSANPALTSMVLIAVNALVWLAVVVTGARGSALTYLLALTPAGRCNAAGGGYYPDLPETWCQLQPGATWHPGVGDGAWWQVVTSGFTHIEVWHIAVNMLSLWVLGPAAEAAFGRLRFLGVYLVSLLAGSTMILWFSSPATLTVGASGAIFGVMGALMVLSWKVHGDVRSVVTLLVVNLAFTFAFPNISWQGHIGGLLGGAAVAAIIVFSPRGPRRSLWQSAGVGLVVAVLLALAVVRALAL